VSAQLDHIYVCRRVGRQVVSDRVFSTSEGTIQALAVRQDDELIMLDTNLNFIRARRKGVLNFKQVSNQSLQKIERLADSIQ